MNELKDTIKEKLDWIESLDTDPETHRNNIIQFNREVKQLIKLGDKVVVPLIERLFIASNRYMLWAAAWILREVGDKRSLDAFWYALNKHKTDSGLQHEFILGICMLKDGNISDDLLEILIQRKGPLVMTAIQGLAILKDNRSVSPLVDLFMNGTQEEYSIIIPGESDIPGVHVKKEIIEALGKIRTEESINELNKILYLDPTRFIEFQHFGRLKCDAIVALATTKKQSAIAIIAEAVKHAQKGVRKMAKKQLDLWDRN